MGYKLKCFTVLSALLVMIAGQAFAAGPPIDPPGLERAMVVQEEHTAAMMAIDGVVGTAVGHGAEGRAAVFVLTAEPWVAGIPNTLDGVPVLVRFTGEFFALHHCKGKHAGEAGCGEPDPPPGEDPPPAECASTTERCDRPVPIGISTGHPDITAGTIGCRVTDGNDVFILSNNHVLADSNGANLNDFTLQPGTFDGGGPGDEIGTVYDFKPIVFGGSPNTMDAAISLSSVADLGNATLSDGYGTPKITTIGASINQKVKKYGRTTGETNGQVFALNATVNVNYGVPGVATFVNQIIITPGTFSAGGDSGSLIVANGKGRNKSDDGKPVGLLFAGSASYTIASPIDPILAWFGVTVDGE